jgi:hypothetical protein
MVQHILLQWLRHSLLVLLLVAVLTACSSPEDGRARGGGPGADAGNKATNAKPESKVFK